MSVKSLIDQVRSQLTDEQLSKVGSVLKSIENEVDDLSNSLSAANSESKNRKIKIRELENKVEDFDVEKQSWGTTKEELENKLNNAMNNKELESLRKFKSNYLKSQADNFARQYEEISKHPKWESAKGFYTIPESDEDGNPDWSKLTEDQLEQNVLKLQEHQSINLFADQKKGTPEPRKGQPGEIPTIESIYKKRNEGDKSWKQDYEAYQKANL